MNKTLVIMAAGMGSRYGGLKQIDSVGPNGEIIIDYSIYDAISAGFNKVVFIIRKENLEIFKEVVGDKVSSKINVEYVFQETDKLPEGSTVSVERVKPWGTGHAVMCCKGVVKEPFAVINADDFYGREAFELVSKWMDTLEEGKKPYSFAMIGYVLKNTLTENGTVSRGICEKDENSNLVSVTERTKIMRNGGNVQYNENDVWYDIDENSVASMNFWGFVPEFIDEAEKGFANFLKSEDKDLSKAEYYLPTAVSELIESKKCNVNVLTTNEKWIGVTYKEDKDAVKSEIASKVESGKYPDNLFGV